MKGTRMYGAPSTEKRKRLRLKDDSRVLVIAAGRICKPLYRRPPARCERSMSYADPAVAA
jgi:hypothetical protein